MCINGLSFSSKLFTSLYATWFFALHDIWDSFFFCSKGLSFSISLFSALLLSFSVLRLIDSSYENIW